MKKEEIYVVIDSEEKRQRAIQILTDAREVIDWSNFELGEILKFDSVAKDWFLTTEEFKESLQETTLDQLEQLLNPQFVVKEVVLSIDELQKQAENLGFELVKKERQIKVGDFGKFWDSDEDNINVGFIINIDKNNSLPYKSDFGSAWINFRHLTEEEKKQIQENW